MSVLTTLLISVLVIVCLLMVLIILMQRPKQEGLGASFGGGMMDSTFGAQTTDVLQKGTVWLTVAFFVLTISIAVIKTRDYAAKAAKGDAILEAVEPAPLPPLPPAIESLTPDLPAPAAEDMKVPVIPSDGEGAEKAPGAEPATSDGATSGEASKPDAPAPAAAETGDSKKEEAEADKADSAKGADADAEASESESPAPPAAKETEEAGTDEAEAAKPEAATSGPAATGAAEETASDKEAP